MLFDQLSVSNLVPKYILYAYQSFMCIANISQTSDTILANHVIAVNQSPHHICNNHIHEFQFATTLTIDQLKMYCNLSYN